jgi:hypothetical protein
MLNAEVKVEGILELPISKFSFELHNSEFTSAFSIQHCFLRVRPSAIGNFEQ